MTMWKPVPVLFATLLLSAAPALAGESWDLAASALLGYSIPHDVSVQITAASPMLDLDVNGLKFEHAASFGGRFAAWKRRTQGLEWGLQGDVQTFHADGTGKPAHIRGTVDGEPIDVVDVTPMDDQRFVTYAAAFLLRWPQGRGGSLRDGRWTPYVGTGAGLAHSRDTQEDGGPTAHSNGVLFQALAGVEIRGSSRVGFLGEYRFSHSRLHFEQDGTTRGWFNDSQLIGGVTLHF